MNHKDLMIGDWVKNDLGEIQEVVELREIGAMLYYNDFYSYDEIEPITLTPEILEKNGFVKQGFPGWEIYTEDFLILWRNDYPDVLDIRSFNAKYGSFHRSHIRYVHELQHALRLCGIDKEIVV